MSRAALFGCTGLVGGHILPALYATDTISVVHTISRRAPKTEGPKLQAVIETDMAQWTKKLAAIQPPPTVVYSAVGTTRAAAGGIKEQWKVDHDINVEIAKAAKEAGVKTFVFISSAGTRGFLASYIPYSQMKNGVEDTIKALDFDNAVIVRPGFILGEREVTHQGGGLAHGVASGLGKISQKAKDGFGQEADVIARAAVHAARLVDEGKAPSKYWILDPSDVVRLGRDEWKD